MTIVVWEGEVLATDAAATDGNAQWRTTKAWYHTCEEGQVILSGAGPLQTILQMRDWFQGGALQNKFPNVQLTPQFCHFLVVNSAGLRRYEQGFLPIAHGMEKCAFGDGKDFAYGALAMGADAARAVEVANELSSHCGLGVKLYKLEEIRYEEK